MATAKRETRSAITSLQLPKPGQELMAVVDVKGLWVTANYKETQLRLMQPGQRGS